MNEALNSVKPIVSNPFHEKVANSEKSIKDVVLKNTIKVAFINQIAKNFGIYENMKAPNGVTEVENYFIKNDQLKSLIQKEKLTIDEFDIIRDELQDELNNYISNMNFKDKIINSETAKDRFNKAVGKIKYAGVVSTDKIKKATGLSKDALGLIWKHKGKIAVSGIILATTFQSIGDWMDAKQLHKSMKTELLSQNVKVNKPTELALLNGQQLFQEVVTRADSYNSDNISMFLEDNFLNNNNYKNYIEGLTKNPYKNGYGFDIGGNENIKRAILIQKGIKEHNLKNNVYVASEIENEKKQLGELEKYLNNFQSSLDKNTSFTEGGLLFEVKKNEIDGKTYLDISNI